MTANELADGILAIEERIFLTKKEHQLFQNSAKMLRQQQAEIEALKKQIPDWENINKPNPFIGNLDKEPHAYKMGDIDWTKALIEKAQEK